MFIVKRSLENPLLNPVRDHPWEAYAVFNWCPILDGDESYYLYRAMSLGELVNESDFYFSIVGIAKSKDEIHFEDRKQFIYPENDWEKFGCEDPRITKLDNKYYITYTALSEYPFTPQGIKVGLAITKKLGKIDEKHLITPFNAKAMVIFPEKINGKITALLTAHTDLPPSKIALAQFEKEEDMWSVDYWQKWEKELDSHEIDLKRLPTDQVEVGSPPIKTEHGWLVVYSHIQNYQTNNKLFGIEAILLDLKNPKKIIGRTKGAMFVSEEIYEKYGHIPNVIFPSGALIKGKDLQIYYGATDSTCCMAKVNLEDLFDSMMEDHGNKYITRFENNPIISPISNHLWEAKATFNPAAIELRGIIHLLYRAMSDENTSTIGYAATLDGYHIAERLDSPIFVPKEDFEMKNIPGGNSGCEDPRLVKLEDKICMCYVVFDGIHPPRGAISTILEEDFIAKKWNWSTSVIVTPEEIDDKDISLFPEKINDKYMILHRIGSHVCVDYFNSLDFKSHQVTRCIQLFGPRSGMWDSKKVGIASPPIKTEKGWLLFYHGVSDHNTYRFGAVMLDLKDPTLLIARTSDPILEPEKNYELEGQVPKVVFPCGIVKRDDKLFIYYGGADKVVCGAEMSLSKLLNFFF